MEKESDSPFLKPSSTGSKAPTLALKTAAKVLLRFLQRLGRIEIKIRPFTT